MRKRQKFKVALCLLKNIICYVLHVPLDLTVKQVTTIYENIIRSSTENCHFPQLKNPNTLHKRINVMFYICSPS